MAATPSTMIPLGTIAPAFELPDPDGRVLRSDDLDVRSGLLVTFICNHCPFVKHIAEELAALGRLCAEHGIDMVAINSNDLERYPDDAPPKMAETAAACGWTFPYLVDATQETARAFDAACTPDFFLYDRQRALVYRGQLDDSRPGNGVPVTGRDLRGAIAALVEGGPISAEQIPSVGCNIKWKPGNEPGTA